MTHARTPARARMNDFLRLRAGAAGARRSVASRPSLKCLRAKYFCAAAAAEGGGRGAGAEEHHALSRRHRQHRAGQDRRSGRARAGLSAIDQLSGRRRRQGRHHAVHDRARDLQAQARTGAGRRSRRAGDGEAGGGRLTSARSIWCRSRRSRSRRWIPPPPPATMRRPVCCRRRSTPRSRRSITAIPMSPRRSTASSPRIWSRSASSSAWPRRRSWRRSSRSIRSM